MVLDAFFEMAQPARSLELSSLADDDPLVSVHLSELDFDGSFEHGPWCVDDGASIVCMETTEIRLAYSRGEIDERTKVWRDGRPCWQSIEEVEELTRRLVRRPAVSAEQPCVLPKPPPVRVVPVEKPPPTRFPTEGCFEEQETPEQSGVRRIRDRRPAVAKVATPRRSVRARPKRTVRSGRFWRPAVAVMAAAAVIVAGVAMFNPSPVGASGKLKRVAVDVGERCLFVADQARMKAQEQPIGRSVKP